MQTGEGATRTVPSIFARFISSDGKEWDTEHLEITPVAGQFIQGSPDGPGAYRIAEVWSIGSKRGAVDYGLTCFVDPVDIMETRLGQYDPEYYGS
jgi:hypothetical protein